MTLPAQPAPHLDPTRWGQLVDSLDVAPILVVIAAWLGPDARREVAVEDVWQETLWMAWRDRNSHQWANLTKYRAWLLGIAHNRVRDVVRDQSRQKRGGDHRIARFSDIGGVDTVGEYLPPRSTTPSRTASHVERARRLERALASVDEPLRELVRLRLFEEVPTEEIATRLQVPLSTCKHRLVRGIQAYRAELQRLGYDAESRSQGS